VERRRLYLGAGMRPPVGVNDVRIMPPAALLPALGSRSERRQIDASRRWRQLLAKAGVCAVGCAAYLRGRLCFNSARWTGAVPNSQPAF
jgi:hypothetical protein